MHIQDRTARGRYVPFPRPVARFRLRLVIRSLSSFYGFAFAGIFEHVYAGDVARSRPIRSLYGAEDLSEHASEHPVCRCRILISCLFTTVCTVRWWWQQGQCR